MPEIKIEGRLPSSANEALSNHARALYDSPGSHRVGIVEFYAAWNEVPAPSEAKKPAVHLRITGLEIAGEDQENDVRRAQRALYLHRTARGTLDESGQLEIEEGVLGVLGEMLHEREAVRLRAGMARWLVEMQKVADNPTLSPVEFRHEFDRLHTGLENLLHPARVTADSE